MTLSAGTRLGPYEILAPLGAGGMGEVYRARDRKLGRDVAIKVLPSEVSADAERRLRFEQEARSASALNHPNIITVYDIGSSESNLYLAMELVEGRTVREMLSADLLPAKKMLDIAVQVADGLAKAHAAGIVHRDLKPENLMISRDGFVKILDFGLAKLVEPAPEEVSALPTVAAPGTLPGTVMGTVGYMSPEQASGEPVDYRSDQFSFGSILYEMATGRRAFQRKTGAETLAAIIREEPEPIGQLNPMAPAPVRWIIERCLVKEPEERYTSTRDLARDLRSVRDHLSETSASEVAVAARRSRPGLPVWFLPAGLALLAGLLLGVFGGKIAGTTKPPTEETTFQRLTFRRGSILSARFAPDGQTVIYGAAWEGSPIEIFATRPESPVSRSLGLASADILSVSSDGELAVSLGRRFVWGWESAGTLARLPLDGGAPREVLEDVQEADWAPDGKSLAVVRRVGNSRLEFPIGKVLYQTAGWISHPQVSPDGNLVAFIDHPQRGDNVGRVMVVDSNGKNRLTGPPAGTGLAWSPRGDEIWFTGPGVQAAALQAVTLSGRIRVVADFPGGVTLQDISRDGRVLLNRDNWRREIVGLAPGESRERNLTWLDWSFPADLSDDGKVLLFTEQAEGTRGVYSSFLRKTDGSPAVLLGQASGAGLSPDGKWALTTGGVGSQQLTLLTTGAGEPKPLPKADITYHGAAWFPDGRRILIMGHEPGRGVRLYVQDLVGGKPRAITPEGVTFFGKVIAPDGRSVAALGPEQRILLYPIEPAEPQAIPGIAPDEQPIRWTPDGRSLYVWRQEDLPAKISIVDVSSGRRTLWKELTPPDPAGVLMIGPILITPDGKSYVYSYRRTLEDLYLAEGLK